MAVTGSVFEGMNDSKSAYLKDPNSSDLMGNMPGPSYSRGVPSETTATQMLDQLAYQRAVQMYLWALPGVGQAYPSGEMTGDGKYLEGDKTYRLQLPHLREQFLRQGNRSNQVRPALARRKSYRDL